jgi:4'-phosphopantetheinyl transferase
MVFMKLYCAPLGSQDGRAAVYSLLEYAFRTEYGTFLPEIKKTPNGKPYFPARVDIHFSLSHAKTHVLCAISNAPVGVDIESPRTISPRAVKFFASVEERSMFDPLDLWVLKESYIKLTGDRLPSVTKLRFSRTGDTIVTPDKMVSAKLYQIDGCRAAVCTSGTDLPDSIEFSAL